MKIFRLVGFSLVLAGCRGSESTEPRATATPARPAFDSVPGRPFFGPSGHPGQIKAGKGAETNAASSLNYEFATGEGFEVAGVCRYSDTEVSCWDGQGRDSQELTKAVQQSFKFASMPLPIGYERKNRLIVVRRREIPSSGGLGRQLTITAVGAEPRNFSATAPGLNIGRYPKPSSDGFLTMYEGRFAAEDPKAQQTSLRITWRAAMKDLVDVPLRKGATVQFQGNRLVVDAVQPVVRRRFPGRGIDQPLWSVRIRREGPDARQVDFAPALDQRPLYVDGKGRRVGNDEYVRWAQAGMKEARRLHHPLDLSGAPFVKADVVSQSFGGDWMEFEFNADPEALATMPLRITETKIVYLKGIPLDPKN